MSNISINGLKLNGPLATLWIDAIESTARSLSALCRLLTGNCINIAYMTTADVLADEPALCCVDRADETKVALLLDGDPELVQQVRMGSDVGLITIYPHRSSFRALGLALQLFSEHDIRIYGLASSISALSFVVDFNQLDFAGSILARKLELPASATPPWSTIKTRQEKPRP